MDPNPIRPSRGKARGRPPIPIIGQPGTQSNQPPGVQGFPPMHPPQSASQISQSGIRGPRPTNTPAQPVQLGAMPRPPRQIPPRGGQSQRPPRPLGPRPTSYMENAPQGAIQGSISGVIITLNFTRCKIQFFMYY